MLDCKIKKIYDNSCNEISNIIAKNLVYTAAEMIFADKFQCIMEPIVNSIDAYNYLKEMQYNIPRKSVGKFGLGFFSLFSILVENPNRRLKLTSHHETGSWTAEIKQECLFVNKFIPGPHVKDFILDYQIIEKDKHGFKLEIFDDPLLEEEDFEFYMEQLYKFKYVKDVNIVVNGEILNKNNNNKQYVVDITCEDHYIKIEDWAIGVSKDLLFNSLLIPSISTKGIKTNIDYNINIGENTGIYLNKSSKKDIFYIMVGEIIVYTQEIEHDNNNNNGGINNNDSDSDSDSDNDGDSDNDNNSESEDVYYEIVLQLNSATPIPASRDDIQIEDLRVQEDFFINITKLMEDCMESSRKYLILSKMLRDYQLKHPFLSSKIENILEGALHDYLKKGYYIVPKKYINLYKKITENIIPYEGTLNVEVEIQLLNNFKFNNNIISGKSVYIINDD